MLSQIIPVITLSFSSWVMIEIVNLKKKLGIEK